MDLALPAVQGGPALPPLPVAVAVAERALLAAPAAMRQALVTLVELAAPRARVALWAHRQP